MLTGSTRGISGGSLPGIRSFAPATPLGIINLLEEYAIDPQGMHAVIVGRSIEVGRPMAALFLSRNATVTVCHSHTRDLAGITTRADLLVHDRVHVLNDRLVQRRQVIRSFLWPGRDTYEDKQKRPTLFLVMISGF
jgi:5,10-methylene-tetrahydrofolate dehydrogenase/methenyl tetrahydrofolate cyclohydrolase